MRTCCQAWLISTSGKHRRHPAASVFIVALLNGLAWAYLTPAFQVPDETAHFAYTQSIVERGVRPGALGRPEFSSEQNAAMSALGTLAIIGRPLVRPPVDSDSAARAVAMTAVDSSRSDGGGPSSASSQPPLFYLLTAGPYLAFDSASITARLHAMRLLSVVIFAVGASLCALTAVEIVSHQRWVALVGGLAIALSPYTAFIASGVTPDTLLFTLSAGVLLMTARILRRGLTRQRAILLGAVVGFGLLTKISFLAFAPPSIAVVLYASWRDRRRFDTWAALGRGQSILATLAATFLVAAAPTLLLIAIGVGETRAARAPLATAAALSSTDPRVGEIAAYAWQLFLPRLPFMSQQFPVSAPVSLWVDGYAGRYGWLDYSVSASVVGAFRGFFVVLVALTTVSAVQTRSAILRHRGELVIYASFFASVATVIAVAGHEYRNRTGLVFEQPRYLFGLLPFYGATVAAACLGVGRRVAPRIATLCVGLFGLHNLTGVAATAIRYYG